MHIIQNEIKSFALSLLSVFVICNYALAQSPSRNLTSQLNYLVPDSINAAGFYTEVSLDESTKNEFDAVTAIGFDKGMLGFETSKGKKHNIVFSLHNHASSKADPAIRLKAKGYNVVQHSNTIYWSYSWREKTGYKFYLNLLKDSASATTIYSGYFFIPELLKWKFLASFEVPDAKPAKRNWYSGVAFNNTMSGLKESKVYFGNQWVPGENGQWKEVTESILENSTLGKPENNLLAGVEENRFYLEKNKISSSLLKSSPVTRPGKNENL